MSYFLKIRLVGAELFHADGQTDRRRKYRQDKPVVAFHNFVNAPSNGDERQHVPLRIDISVALDAYY